MFHPTNTNTLICVHPVHLFVHCYHFLLRQLMHYRFKILYATNFFKLVTMKRFEALLKLPIPTRGRKYCTFIRGLVYSCSLMFQLICSSRRVFLVTVYCRSQLLNEFQIALKAKLSGLQDQRCRNFEPQYIGRHNHCCYCHKFRFILEVLLNFWEIHRKLIEQEFRDQVCRLLCNCRKI